ncbi:stage II sporulation protein M [Haloferula sp.]|uniref:stage II sporulation protein M n=1 Tax=Haloferula sp. TaxID=2497595 RepID=UPI00329F0F58
MNSGNFQDRREEAWQELDQMIESVEKGKPVPGVEQLPKKFREACSDLALANHRMYGRSVVNRLNDLVIRGYKLLYRSRRKGGESFVRFVGVTFPAAVRKESRLFWLCSAMFWLPFFGMMLMAEVNIDWVQSILGPEGMSGLERMYGGEAEQIAHLRSEYGSNFRMFAFYIEHNISIDFRIFAGGIVAGLGTIFFTVYNGLAIGASAGYVNYACDKESFWTFVAGHSSFELIGMVIAAMAGMRLGMGVLKPGRMSRGKAIVASAKQSLPLIFGAAGMTALAAVVEGFWSAQPFPPMVKYSFGATMWLLHIAYFTLLGRGEREA